MINNQTKQCTCGKLMILRFSGMTLAVYPAIHLTQWFCGGCGKTEIGPQIRDKTNEQIAMEEWEKANSQESAIHD